MTTTVLPEHAKCQGDWMRKLNENCRRRYNLSDLFSYIQDLIFEIKKIAKSLEEVFCVIRNKPVQNLKRKCVLKKKVHRSSKNTRQVQVKCGTSRNNSCSSSKELVQNCKMKNNLKQDYRLHS